MQLIERVRQHASGRLRQVAALPTGLRMDFDPAVEEPLPSERVVKTSRRTVTTLQGRFDAREFVRRQADNGHSRRSSQLARLAPRGASYGFDLIAHVGVETLLRGQRMGDVQRNLAELQPPVRIPTSSLHDQQQKFLFCLGSLHRQAAPRLREFLAGQQGVTWLLDGTLEADSPVFLGIQDSASSIMLMSSKIPSERADDIEPSLRQAAQWFGRPDRVLHDLSPAMNGGCEAGLPEVPHFVCHYHLVRDIGEDLYQEPQDALCKRLRALKVQLRMRDQRKAQNEHLRKSSDPDAEQILAALLAGQPLEVAFSDSLGRRVLLAFHYWILDYRSDGRRRGYPFDPYTLYLHRRLVKAAEAMQRLLRNDAVAKQAPQVLRNFGRLLNTYLQDSEIAAAASLYERACAMFNRLRKALRMTADQMNNLRQVQELSAEEQDQLETELQALRTELREQSRGGDVDGPLARTVVEHLDKFWPHLVPQKPLAAKAGSARTTSPLEGSWSGLKRVRRRAHGRGKLTRDFHALPEEYVLISNLENPAYVDLVLDGNLDQLPEKLATAAATAGPFSHWQRQHKHRLIGKPPRRLLREDKFIDHLVEACYEYCNAPDTPAA